MGWHQVQRAVEWAVKAHADSLQQLEQGACTCSAAKLKSSSYQHPAQPITCSSVETTNQGIKSTRLRHLQQAQNPSQNSPQSNRRSTGVWLQGRVCQCLERPLHLVWNEGSQTREQAVDVDHDLQCSDAPLRLRRATMPSIRIFAGPSVSTSRSNASTKHNTQ